jgi:peptidyl-prolyl cis-trans isomerase NIMA-interacting 1
MPGKVWAHCIGLCLSMALALSTFACAAPAQPPSRAPAATVVNLEGASQASQSEERDLPALGDATAPVTVVALVGFDDAESAALYQSLSELQRRFGPRELRLVLVTRGAELAPSRAELIGQALQRDAGDAAYFDFATRLFGTTPGSFGDTLKLALEVSRLHERDTAPSPAEPDRSASVVRAEADALLDDVRVPALSVNGIRVLGHLSPSRLERLLSAEHEAARALGRTGVAAHAVYPERVADNANRVVQAAVPPAAPAAAAETPDELLEPDQPAPSATPESDSITASHILIAYRGAMRAKPAVTRRKSEAKALAQKLVDRLRGGTLDFGEAAARYSDEPGADARKGALGSFTKSRMVKPFGDAAFALAPGEISNVVETDFGFHIIWREQ